MRQNFNVLSLDALNVTPIITTFPHNLQNVAANDTSQFQPPSTTSSIISCPAKVQTSNTIATPSSRIPTPPLVVLDEAPPASVQILDYIEPHSVQVLDSQKQLSPAIVSSRSTEVTIEESNAEHAKKNMNCARVLNSVGVSGAEDVQVYEVSGFSSDIYNQGANVLANLVSLYMTVNTFLLRWSRRKQTHIIIRTIEVIFC